MTKVEKIELTRLKLDYKNPRLSEFGLNSKTKENESLEILWVEMAVNELMYSIVSNGYFEYEPLIAIKDGSEYIVIEGNRRLAAVKLIHNPDQLANAKVPTHITEKITNELLKETSTLPVIVVERRKDAWEYIGFKHVNGPAKWGSYAKAKYISEIRNDYRISIEDIAYQIGDTNKTAQKLYQGIMILEQAEKEAGFDRDDIQTKRIYFSHLYTGIQREGIRSFLNLKSVSEESTSPVPKENMGKLKELMVWLYGSKIDDKQPVIKSQNPDLKLLDEVLQSKEATYALRAGEPLSYCFDLSRATDAIFEENLLAAKRNLQKARAYFSTGYDGSESLLKVAGSIAEIADDLYNDVEKKFKEKKGGKTRITE